MGCRDVHAATVLSFLCGIASVAGLFAGTLLPNWRKLRLITFNRNEKNLTVYTGLWVKCARYDGGNDCLMYDAAWYSSVDQLDLRVLQFALPLSILIAMGALLLCLIGMCNTAFRSSVPNIKLAKCLVNSAGCHLVAGLLFFLAGTVSLSPSIWVIFYNIHLNRKFEPVFAFDYAVYKDKQRPKTMNDECTAADNCQSCINRKKCFWCSKEKACKKICFPNSECPASCSFWLNCQVDVFGFLMLLLLVIMVIAFICQFCIYQHYLQRTRVYIGGRPHAVYIPHGGDPVYNE
ncbi:hypothetical protein R6Z07F_005595 [Ovis aries]